MVRVIGAPGGIRTPDTQFRRLDAIGADASSLPFVNGCAWRGVATLFVSTTMATDPESRRTSKKDALEPGVDRVTPTLLPECPRLIAVRETGESRTVCLQKLHAPNHLARVQSFIDQHKLGHQLTNRPGVLP